ncbi:TPA: hypothetical protein K8052_002199 [Staphylococcus pseudintermedius]|uniref:hypothetical protein n=2 Tax=cellular organisms TaxID=131567 RepID=UPI001A072C6F|nr:hypothetical protein [Staphylococcus pseudintermedius]EHT8037717.1 hypothetical protein [Staphylococcus pseudintermedius]EII6309365.1 hypothetical protein [Staphylococcus pseudintermedius]EIM5204679.1 hypothetical protein [Staphylococcus pseudintermedius]EJD8447644.1 hypothetical protein [Staphylococcus pseudintermedius]
MLEMEVYKMTAKNKQKQISIRLTDEEYSKIYILSALEHVNPTQYVKQKALTKTRPIVLKNIELIEKLQQENEQLKEEQAEVKRVLIERLVTILHLRTS